MLGFIALVAISSQLAPYLTRREIFVGVTAHAGARRKRASSWRRLASGQSRCRESKAIR
jgi:hypothetical protein